MASDSTVLKKLKQIPRKTTTTTDMEDLNDLAIHHDEEVAYAALSAEDCVIGGFAVSFSSGSDISISAGSALKQGQLIKNTAAATETIAANGAGSDRIDLVSISGVTETDSDNLIEPVLSAIALNDFGKPTPDSIGTGDGSTKLFELPVTSSERVRADTVLVYEDAALVGGWVFAPGQGSSGEDCVIFHDAPASGVALTASGDFVTGGEEALPTSPGLPSRSALTATFTITQGVPGGSAPALPSGHVRLCEVTVPAGWSSGAGLTFDNEVDKNFLVTKDAESDASGRSPFDRPARLADSIRNMAQVRHGCRLRYVSSTQIAVSPGFIVSHGLACRNESDATLTITTAEAPTTGWYPIYAIPQAPAANGSGQSFTVGVGGSGPNSLAQEWQLPLVNPGTFYLGYVYCTVSGATVTIRPFYSDGDGWVWWEQSTYVSMTHNTDEDFSDWCPPTARMVDFQAKVTFTPISPGDTCTFQMRSHKTATAKAEPILAEDRRAYTGGSGGSEILQPRGIIKLEEDSGALYCYPHVSATGSATITGRVKGYKDDYLINDTSGAALFY